MKTEVYSWRVSRELKSGLELEARRRKLSLSAVLDLAAAEWLRQSQGDSQSEAGQQRLRESAMKSFGAFAGGDPSRSRNTRDSVRARLSKRYDR